MEHYPQFNEEWQDSEKTPPEGEERSFLSDVIRAMVGILLIISMLWLVGGYNIFRFRETPQNTPQEPITSEVDAQEIIIPLNIIVLRSDGAVGSRRDNENVRTLVRKASNIWAQANITLELQDTRVVNLTDEEIFSFLEHPQLFTSIDVHDSGAINIVLVRHIPGSVNGISYGGLNTVAVADITTVFDFRTLAHEIGHVFRLEHVSNQNQLMSSGVNGTSLVQEEIIRSRTSAQRF